MSALDPRRPDRDFLATLTLLYVEDDAETREQMYEFLRWRLGRVLMACDGLEGLEVCRLTPPDLVLTDIQMPGMDGLTMAAELGRLGRRVPVLVTTAFEQPEYLLRCIELGVERFVAKPVEPARLESALLDCAHRLRADAHLARRTRLAAELQRSQALSLLAGGIAHDYDNLVQVLLLNVTEAMERTAPDSDVHELLMEATGCAVDAGRLGERLRQLAGGDLFTWEAVALEPLVQEAVGTVVGGTGVHHQLVRGDWGPRELLVTGDRRHLAALFAQLATNAVEAMAGGGTLTTWVSPAPAEQLEELGLPAAPHVHLELKDTGPGIDPAHLRRVFDPYFSTRERGPAHGVGLGLTICRSIAEKHRGQITAESLPGEGASFHVYLPLMGS